MVVHSSSVRVITHSNLSQLPPMLMNLGKWPAVMLSIKRLACVAPEMDLRECTLHSPLHNKGTRLNPIWLWDPEETSSKIQNTFIHSIDYAKMVHVIGTSQFLREYLILVLLPCDWLRAQESSASFCSLLWLAEQKTKCVWYYDHQ